MAFFRQVPVAPPLCSALRLRFSGALRRGDTHWGFSEASAIYFQEAGIPNALVPLGARGLPASSPITVVPAAVVPVPSIGGGLLPGTTLSPGKKEFLLQLMLWILFIETLHTHYVPEFSYLDEAGVGIIPLSQMRKLRQRQVEC